MIVQLDIFHVQLQLHKSNDRFDISLQQINERIMITATRSMMFTIWRATRDDVFWSRFSFWSAEIVCNKKKWIERISPATSAAQPREFVCNSIKILSAVDFLSPQTCPYFIVCIVVQPTAGVCIILLEEWKSSPALSCVSLSLFSLFVCCVKWRNPISKFSEIDMRISGIWKTYKLVAVAVAMIAFQREKLKWGSRKHKVNLNSASAHIDSGRAQCCAVVRGKLSSIIENQNALNDSTNSLQC